MHNLENPKRRVNQYFNIDGLLELATGVGFLTIALAAFLADRRYAAVGPGFYPLIWLPLFLGIPLIFHIPEWLKNHITYPRTGFVKPHYPKYLRRRYMFPIFFVGPFLLFELPIFFGREPLIPTTLFFYSVLLAAVFLLIGQGLRRFYGYAAVVLATGVGVSVMGLEPLPGMMILCLVTGIVTGVAGALVLRNYLKRNPETKR